MSVEYFCRLLPHMMDELLKLYDDWCGYYYQRGITPWRLNKPVKAILLSFQVLRRHPGEE